MVIVRNHSAMVADTVKQLRTVTLVRACADQKSFVTTDQPKEPLKLFLLILPDPEWTVLYLSLIHI